MLRSYHENTIRHVLDALLGEGGVGLFRYGLGGCGNSAGSVMEVPLAKIFPLVISCHFFQMSARRRPPNRRPLVRERRGPIYVASYSENAVNIFSVPGNYPHFALLRSFSCVSSLLAFEGIRVWLPIQRTQSIFSQCRAIIRTSHCCEAFLA